MSKKVILKRINSLALFIICTIFLSSCNIGVKHIDISYLKDQKLIKGDGVDLLLDINRPESGDVVLIVNSNKELGRDSLRLSLSIETPLRKYWCDTLNVSLNDNRYSLSKRKNEIKLITNSSFDEIGLYRFTISNCDDTDFEGVSEIGIALIDNK